MRSRQLNWRYLIGALALLQVICSAPTPAQRLVGGVQEESYRLAPANTKKQEGDSAKSNPFRLGRTIQDEDEDDGDLSKPQTTSLKGSLDDFQANSFDLGPERESAEMVLAWERWHHQFSAELWHRWYATNQYKGRAQIKITVTRDLHISVECVKRRGCLEFENTILRAVNSLDLNPGLTFPAKSERQSVTFVTNILAGNVPPSYSWSKHDFETVKKDPTSKP